MSKGNKNKKEEKGITAKKENNFSEWYTQVVLKSELADYSEVSGSIIFRPLGYSIWEKVKDTIDPKFKALGIKNVYFPLLIPESALKKESTHIKGFVPEASCQIHSLSALHAIQRSNGQSTWRPTPTGGTA